MSGHSHWAGIKHRKGLNDAKRAQVFTKLAKPIVIAARVGGGNPDANFKLRLAIDKAHEFNMPKENIDRAIARGTGELKGEAITEMIYEAMGPAGIMMLIKATTDNKNRTVSEIKNILTKAGAKFSETGSVMWNFEPAGVICVDFSNQNKDQLELLAIDAGAKDIKIEEDTINIFTNPKDLWKVQDTIRAKGIKISDFGLIYLPKSTVKIDGPTRLAYEKLLEQLDEQDDVEEIYDNL